MIYITEAHAADVWPIGRSAGTINYKHKTIQDRSMYAYKFQKEYDTHFPIYLDNMKNQLETAYSSWPFRYHVIQKNKITMVPEPVDSEFLIEELTEHLEELELSEKEKRSKEDTIPQQGIVSDVERETEVEDKDEIRPAPINKITTKSKSKAN